MAEDPSPNPSLPNDEAMLLTWLSTHNAPCPACKYNLRYLTVPRCPECGRPLSLAVTVIEPYLRTWIALVVVLCVNAGPGVFLSIALLNTLFENHPLDLPNEWWYRFLIFFYLIVAPLAVASLLLRQRFVRLSRPAQLWIVLTFVGITLAAFITVLWEMAH